MKKESSHKAILVWLLLGFLSFALLACGSDSDDDGDNGGGISLDGNEAESSGDLAPDETSEYLATIPEEADTIYAATEEVGEQYILSLSRVGGGSSSRGGSGAHEVSMNNVGDNEYRILVSNASEVDISYGLSVWLDPEDVDLELEKVEDDGDRSAVLQAAAPSSDAQTRSDTSSEHLPVIADVLRKAAEQKEERAVYNVHDNNQLIGDVTVYVDTHQSVKEVRFYGRIKSEGTDQRFATEPDAPVRLHGNSSKPTEGRFWVFAHGGLSAGLMGQDTGTAADAQLITEPGPFVEEVQIEKAQGEHRLDPH